MLTGANTPASGETRQTARFCRAGHAFLKAGPSKRAFCCIFLPQTCRNARSDRLTFKKARPARQKRAACRVSPSKTLENIRFSQHGAPNFEVQRLNQEKGPILKLTCDNTAQFRGFLGGPSPQSSSQKKIIVTTVLLRGTV